MKKLLRITRLLMCLCAIFTSTTAFAGAQWIGNSYININGTWYNGSGTEDWATGGTFDDLGAIGSLAIGGQVQIGDNGNNWQSGTVIMYYQIDGGTIHDHNLDYKDYGFGEYNNNMRFQSGGTGEFTEEIVDISSLSYGSHTLTIHFGPIDGQRDPSGDGCYSATFTKALDISGATVTGVDASYEWTGDAIHPVPVVTVGGTALSSTTDYDVTYSDGCTQGGNYSVTITGKGNYAGTKVVNFTINNVYYLVGNMNSWNWKNTPRYKLIRNEGADTDEYFIDNISLSENDEIKVTSPSTGEYGAWYPDGMDNSYVIGHNGTYTIYFRPNGDGGEGWYENYFYLAQEENIEVTLAPTGYGTFYNNRDVTLPAGVVAYVMKDATPTYEKIADGDGDGTTVKKTIPAGVAVLLYSASKPSKITLTSKAFDSDDRTFTTNLLHGSVAETTTTGGSTYYKLTYGNDNTTFGWYYGEDGGAAFTSPAHKAWLALPSSGARSFLGLPGEVTGISTVGNKQIDNVWYDLNGRRINAPMTKGIYVKDGHKVVIK